jgi:hypothetical protein
VTGRPGVWPNHEELDVPNITPTTTNAPGPRGFTMRGLVDELVRRLGPDEACRQVSDAATIEELYRLADRYDKLDPPRNRAAEFRDEYRRGTGAP